MYVYVFVPRHDESMAMLYPYTLGSQGVYPRVYGCHDNPVVLKLSLSKVLLPLDVTR